MKIALALFVKNEIQDIAGWISWHLALGVDKIFIYDDHSTDGTFEFLKIVSEVYNIELHRTNTQAIADFYYRQTTSYEEACWKARGNYDWIMCLDGDEYVSLEKANSLSEFLEDFSDFNGVVLNWRFYGSSGRVLRPRIPAYEAYTAHCKPDFKDCEIGKVFIRPEDYTFTYENPHYFRLHDERYANAVGHPVPSPINTKDIVWAGACVNHYLVRSMEHYIDRIRKRYGSDLQNSTAYWDHFNRNEISGHERPEIVEKANAILARIREACLNHYLQNISGGRLLPYGNPAAAWYLTIRREGCHTLSLDASDARAVLARPGMGDGTQPLSAAIYADSPWTVYLFNEKGGHISSVPFRIKGDPVARTVFTYALQKNDAVESWTLRAPRKQRYLAIAPLQEGGQVSADSQGWGHHEQYRLVMKSYHPPMLSACPGSLENREDFFHYLRSNRDRMTCDDFMLAFSTLPETCRAELTQEEHGRAISWI
ncbi:hypothetical protein A0U92_01725 [Acetobacter aceti]|uniref:Uncharacterized protein n=1 Tax=Acetobacter aceti TaxID=435 RepID=A0A1U9KD73_ACEAC|nr:hypothetical protein A0U92_01725 [Acetobacter aceti]